MVAHQHVGVNLQGVARGALAQQTEIVAAVVVIEKDGTSIDAALRDVEWHSRDFHASLARHVRGRRRERPVSTCSAADRIGQTRWRG